MHQLLGLEELVLQAMVHNLFGCIRILFEAVLKINGKLSSQAYEPTTQTFRSSLSKPDLSYSRARVR